jgi:tetratricopeptide (TPR) repeat protein
MWTWASVLLSLLLCACASAPPPAPRPDSLFHDELFAAPTDRVSADDVFALNDPMRHYLRTEIAHQLRLKGAQRGLIDALYDRRQLRIDYDASRTRNAMEAFEARAGNCLSLVIMTAAFAKELGLSVEYQSAYTEETWSRNGKLLFRSGHVNVTLGRRLVDTRTGHELNSLTIDFLGVEDVRSLRTRVISEETVISMYMNNRAAEALIKGELDNAYAWAREALRRNPDFTNAYNTLGVVYLHHGDAARAEQVFARALEREPDNTGTMSNLASAMLRLGRDAEANVLLQKVARLNPTPPFHFFDLGMAAMQRQDYRTARDLFEKEVARADYYHEFQFWLGVANYKLGDLAEARKHLALAVENSTTRSDHDLYAAKLAWLRAHQ